MPTYPTSPMAVAAGTPQLANVNPIVFSAMMTVKFYQDSIATKIANTKYEGEIKDMGSEVVIREINDAQINTYAKNAATAMHNIDPTTVVLSIDKGYYFYEKVDSIDKVQSDIDYLKKVQEDGNKRMLVKVDDQMFNSDPIYSDAATANAGQTAGVVSADIDLGYTSNPLAWTNTNALEVMVEKAGTVLDEQNVPDDGDRWIVLPSWACQRIKTGDVKNAAVMGDGQSVLRKRNFIGTIDGWNIYKSNSIAKDASSGYHCPFGHKSALAFASQYTKTDMFDKLEGTAGEAVRSIMVFGYKVINAKGVGDLYIKKG